MPAASSLRQKTLKNRTNSGAAAKISRLCQEELFSGARLAATIGIRAVAASAQVARQSGAPNHQFLGGLPDGGAGGGFTTP